MPEQPGAGRLDPETLAAYIDGLLPPEELARVEAAIAADPDSYEWVVNSINAVDDPEIVAATGERSLEPVPAVPPGGATEAPTPPAPAPPKHDDGGGDPANKVLPFYRRRALMGGIGLLLATAATVLLVVQTESKNPRRVFLVLDEGGIAKLVAAVGEERYIEARLTGGFKYGPMRQVMRGPNDLSSQNLQLLATAGELQKVAEKDPSADNLHAWGVAQLLLGRFNESLETLRGAATKRADDAIVCDLAAALLAQDRFRGESQGAAEALSLLKNLETPEAIYNRALALSALGREAEAREAWQAAARAEQTGEWGADAAARASRR
jgi:hypothetical protein